MLSDSKTIFIIEDDEPTIDLLNYELGKYFIVYTFKEADEVFFRFLRSVKPSLIILDWILPNCNAQEVIKEARSVYGISTKIMVVSAAKNVDQFVAGQNVDKVLAKPFGLKNLKKHILTLLDFSPEYMNRRLENPGLSTEETEGE